MYRSILKCDNKEPVLCKNFKTQEVEEIKVINTPSLKEGIIYLNKSNLVEAPSVKSGCGYVALNNFNECGFDGRQVEHPGPNVGLECDDENCNPYIFTNATVPVDRPPLQSRKNTTSPDDLPVYTTTLNYNNYSDINIGDWVYYVDKNMATPYHSPNFVISGQAQEQYYTDPMGRVSLQFPTQRMSKEAKEISQYPDLRNELIHRENIMASYEELIGGNKNDYTKAYYS